MANSVCPLWALLETFLGHAGAMRILRFTPDLIREEIVAGRCWRGDPQGACGPSRLCFVVLLFCGQCQKDVLYTQVGLFLPSRVCHGQEAIRGFRAPSCSRRPAR